MIRFSISSGVIKEVYLTVLSFLPWTTSGSGRSFSSFLLPELQSPDSDIPVTLSEASWIASIVLFSTPFGCIIGAIIQDTFGRKLGIQAPFIPFALAWAFIAFSSNVYMIYVGMLCNGLGTGMSFSSIVYFGEMSSRERRGSLGSLLLTMLSFGILISYILTYLFTWRICAICFLVLSITCFLVLFSIPESPVWLVLQGKNEEAYKILLWLHDSQSDAVQNLQESQKQKTVKEASNKRSLKDIVIELYNGKKALTIIITIAMLQQLGGFTIMMAYSKLFFSSLEIPFESSLASIIFAIDFFIISFIFPVVVDKVSRRTAQILAGTSLLCCWLIVMVYEICFFNSDDKPFYWVILVTIFVSVVPASFLCMCFPIMILGEIVPADKKGLYVGILGVVVYLSGAVITKMYPYILSCYGVIATIGIFAFFSGVNIPFGIFLCPDTRGKSFEEIQEQYFRKNNLPTTNKEIERY